VGYCIEYAVGDGVLRATLSGRASARAPAIARDIGEQARSSAVQQVLLDVRRLQDRVGRLRALLAGTPAPKRIAVVDSWRNDRHYVFAELAARPLGCEVRRFDEREEALAWLRA
jgi:hypothetical protein